MACCGQGQRKPLKSNGRICPKCGWAMYRVHKYDTNTRQVVKYWICSNKRVLKIGTCGFREKIE